jgi:hypothetical protein
MTGELLRDSKGRLRLEQSYLVVCPCHRKQGALGVPVQCRQRAQERFKRFVVVSHGDIPQSDVVVVASCSHHAAARTKHHAVKSLIIRFELCYQLSRRVTIYLLVAEATTQRLVHPNNTLAHAEKFNIGPRHGSHRH